MSVTIKITRFQLVWKQQICFFIYIDRMLYRFITFYVTLFLLILICFRSDAAITKNIEPVTEINKQSITRRSTITVELSAGARFILNFKTEYGQNVRFKNPGNKDTVITREFLLSKPTLFSDIVDPVQNIFKTLMVFPGDSVVLSQNGETVAYATSYPDFIEKLIDIPPLFYQYNPVFIKVLNQQNATLAAASIEKTYELNDLKIKSSVLPDRLKKNVFSLNNLIRYELYTYINQDQLSVAETKLMDSISREMILIRPEFESLNTEVKEVISNYLIRRDYIKSNRKLMADFWMEVNDVSVETNASSYYYSYLVSQAQSHFLYNYKELTLINSKLKKIKRPNSTLQKVITFSNILLKTKTDFIAAKKELKKFENGKYFYLFENERVANHELRNIVKIKAEILQNINGEKRQFSKILESDIKIYVIDFWASWCRPCIDDHPFFKQIQKDFKRESVQFISISIDHTEAVRSWFTVLKKLGTDKDHNQFMLENAKDSPLKTFFNIKSIPRYVVIDQMGNVLDEDFLKPSEPGFSMELSKLLDR